MNERILPELRGTVDILRADPIVTRVYIAPITRTKERGGFRRSETTMIGVKIEAQRVGEYQVILAYTADPLAVRKTIVNLWS